MIDRNLRAQQCGMPSLSIVDQAVGLLAIDFSDGRVGVEDHKVVHVFFVREWELQ